VPVGTVSRRGTEGWTYEGGIWVKTTHKSGVPHRSSLAPSTTSPPTSGKEPKEDQGRVSSQGGGIERTQ